MRCSAAVALLLCLPGCSVWFFSGESWIDRSQPAVLVETTGGIECGAATEFGVLTLGRSATEGPCRVHYFLGPTPVVESGTLAPTGSVFARAEIDLKTQLVRALDRAPLPIDTLIVMWTPDGTTIRELPVQLVRVDGISGDVLADPGEPLPAGATVLCRGESMWLFAGLIAGRATLGGSAHDGTYYVFAGVDRIRELLAVPDRHPIDLQPKYRLDDISVMKPQPPPPAPPAEEPEPAPSPLPIFPPR
jgi:hypothetical protein